jgi:hypothetical protein
MRVSKIVASLILGALVINNVTIHTFADSTTVMYDSSTDAEAGTVRNVLVNVECAEQYTVTLPKTIQIDGTQQQVVTEYPVTVQGEISEAHYIRVIPETESELYLEDVANVSIPMQIAQTKRRWSSTEVQSETQTKGQISIANVKPGKWSGHISFAVSLDDSGVWQSATCTEPMKCLGYDSNDNGVIDANEQLTDTVMKGTALGHKFAEDDDSFPSICTRCNTTVYAIRTAAQLTAFKDSVNAGNMYADTTIELVNDIDMQNTVWTEGIGTNNALFKGVFNGNGYTIKNVNITIDTLQNQRVGFFGHVFPGVTIENLNIDGLHITATNMGIVNMGSLIGTVAAVNTDATTIKNCALYNVQLDSTESNKGCIGGIIGTGMHVDIENVAIVGHSTNSFITNGGGLLASTGVAGIVDTLNISNSYIDMQNDLGNAQGLLYNAIDLSNTVYSTHNMQTKVSNTVVVDRSNQANKVSTDVTLTETNVQVLDIISSKTKAAVTVLNTDNDTGLWTLDLENKYDGVPNISTK